jgi:methylase of polypeptide subunit release factors
LDVDTGTGLQLRALHDAQPELELYGLDLSSVAIRIARTYLQELEVELRQGSIELAPLRPNPSPLILDTCPL